MREKLSKLIEVRKIIALLMSLVFCYLALAKIIGADVYIPVFSMVIGYYFGKDTALDKPGEKVE